MTGKNKTGNIVMIINIVLILGLFVAIVLNGINGLESRHGQQVKQATTSQNLRLNRIFWNVKNKVRRLKE